MLQEINHTTIPMLLRNVVPAIKSPEETFLLEKIGKSYQPVTFGETLHKADVISSWFLHNGMEKRDRIGFIIDNSPAYVFYDQALQQIGCINVSIYPTLSDSEIAYIINDSGLRTLLVGTPFNLQKILKIADQCPSLEFIIPAFEPKKELVFTGKAHILTFSKLCEEGEGLLPRYEQEIALARVSVLSSDVSSFIYTSGTTGTPKGAILTHGNFVSNIKSGLKHLPDLGSDDLFLSFLPLSHVFERTITYHAACAIGAQIAFAQSLELLAHNMQEVKPTVLTTVPRLLERINEKAEKNAVVAGGIKAKIFFWAFGIGDKVRVLKEQNEQPGLFLSAQHALAEKLVFSKIKEKMGGRMRYIFSGGAALPQSVCRFFANLDMKILEGYGLTETSPAVAITEKDRLIIGTVGRVLPCGITIAIQNPDTKEIYTEQTHESFNPNFESPEGEIIVKGPNIMLGYWNQLEETKNAIDEQGWFHTGDIGRFYKGNLQITDRIKNILINSFGKNVYPTSIENTYLKSPRIEQIFLIGNKREYITAIISPSKEGLKEVFGLTDAFFEEEASFIADEKIIIWIKEDIKRLSRDLAKFEHVKNFILKRRPFTLESGELTPTLKTKRKVIEQNYAAEIDTMYHHNTEHIF